MANKRIPRPNNRILKKEYNKGYSNGYLVCCNNMDASLKNLRDKLLKLAPLSLQAIDYAKAGLDVSTQVSVTKLLEVLSDISDLVDVSTKEEKNE